MYIYIYIMYVLYERHEILLMESEHLCYKDDQEKYMHCLFKKCAS